MSMLFLLPVKLFKPLFLHYLSTLKGTLLHMLKEHFGAPSWQKNTYLQ